MSAEGTVELTGDNALTLAEVDRLKSMLNTTVAHDGRSVLHDGTSGGDEQCLGCSLREKLEKAEG